MAGGVFRDPLIQLTLPISFGYSLPARFGTAAIKMAKIEGMLALAAESVIQTKVQPYRAELGFEDAGFATGAKNVLIASGELQLLLQHLWVYLKVLDILWTS